jgi:hypothetical protein
MLRPSARGGAIGGATAGGSAIVGGGAIVTAQLGSAPIEYYLPRLRELTPGMRTLLSEIDEVGYSPLRKGAEEPPAPGFKLSELRDIDGLIVYRFTSSAPVRVSTEALLRSAITEESRAEVLLPAASTLKTH